MSRLHRVCHTWHDTEACVPAPGSWGGLSSSPSHQRDAALRAHGSHRTGGPARYCQRRAHFWTTAESQMSTVLTGSIATKAYIPVFFCHHSQDKSLLSSVLFFFCALSSPHYSISSCYFISSLFPCLEPVHEALRNFHSIINAPVSSASSLSLFLCCM